MTRVLVVSANLGSYDRFTEWPSLIAPEGVTVDVRRCYDEDFPPRPLAMTSRLMCGIPKMFAWKRWPGYDAYIWIDASCAPTPHAVAWFLEQLGDADLAVFQHPERKTIRAEVEFMRTRMARRGETYLNSRYRGEWIDPLFRSILNNDAFIDDALYASTAFIYRPTPHVIAMMKEWWLSKSLYCLHDQIAWPYVIAQAGCRVRVIPESYLRCPALTFTRNRKIA